jgi:hypothetical protein
MSTLYVSENLKLESSPALKHFAVCIEAVVREAISDNGYDEETAREYLKLHAKFFDKTLGKLHHAYHCHHPMWSTKVSPRALSKNVDLGVVGGNEEEEEKGSVHGGEGALPVRSDVQQDQPTQGAATQTASVKSITDDNTPSDFSCVVTVADVERDLENFEAEFGQRFSEMKDAVALLPRFPSAEKLAQGALSLGVSVERLQECLLQMGAGRG